MGNRLDRTLGKARAAVTTSIMALGAALAIAVSGCGQGPEKQPAATQAAPGKTAVYHGSLDGTSGEYIIGWAWDPDHPNDSVTVAFYDGDTLLGATKADTLRKDLADKKIGTGKYGFALPIPTGLRDGKAHQVHARLQGTDTELADSPKSLTPGAGK
jgi:hypothetical protein